MIQKIFALAFFLSIVMSTSAFAGTDRLGVPRIAYLEPNDEAVVDLTGKAALAFKWKNQPIPSDGRHAFRFKLIKGFGYDTVVSEELGRDVFSIKVPADKFENGATYSWYVQQRDASKMLWSRFETWSFKVKK